MNKNEWRTPPELFKRYDDIYHFEIDLAATEQNHLCEMYFTKSINALERDWLEYKTCWCNPPYSGNGELDKWIYKSFAMLHTANCQQIDWALVLLLPSRTGTAWFEDVWNERMGISGVYVEFLRGRVAFLDEENKPCKGNPESSIVVTMRSDTY